MSQPTPTTEEKAGRSVVYCDTPTHIKRLADKIGQAKAAEAIGVSQSHMSQLVAGGDKCRLAFDLAAKAVLMQMNSDAYKIETAVVRVPKEKKELFVTFLKGAELRFSFWDLR